MNVIYLKVNLTQLSTKMKTPEEWADMYFKDKVRNLPDLIKMVQDEAKKEVIDEIKKAVDKL